MIIDCLACLHGHYPKLEGGDILIVAGDLTARDTKDEYIIFGDWMQKQNYRCKIVICGNHDGRIEKIHKDCAIPDDLKLPRMFINPFMLFGIEYLCDSGTEFKGLKIWGSPWVRGFKGMNPLYKAFTVDTEEELAEKWELIPPVIDILITHSPSFGNYDWVKNRDGSIGPSIGSLSLWFKCLEIRPKVHIFGHIHEAYGHADHTNG